MSSRFRLNFEDIERTAVGLLVYAAGAALVAGGEYLGALSLDGQEQVLASLFAGAAVNLGRRLVTDYSPK